MSILGTCPECLHHTDGMCDLRPRICLNYDHFERRPMVTLTRDDFEKLYISRAAYDELNAKVAALQTALREANEDGLDIATLEYAAKWIENSLAGETSDRVIEFGKSMAMSIRAAKPLVKICAECGGSGEVAGDYFSDDGMSTCARCNGVGHERI